MKIAPLLISIVFLMPQSHGRQFSGYTEPSKVLDLALPEPGVITELAVQEGDAVVPGQLLAALDNQLLNIELLMAQQRLDFQKTRFKKIEELESNNKLSRSEYDLAKTDLSIQELTVKRLKTQIERRTLRSTITGIVDKIYKDQAEGVANPESIILRLVQTSTLIVNLFVEFEYALDLRVGQSLPLLLEPNSTSAFAKIVYISPSIDKASRTLRVTLEVPNEDGKLLSGVACNVEIPNNRDSS